MKLRVYLLSILKFKMCGIIGEISHKSIKSTEWISKAGIVTHHRGPDYFGKWISQEKKVAFGHNRLSIIDLSSDGINQCFPHAQIM